jgi:hypothetical protein
MNIEMFVKQMNGEHKEGIIQKHITRQYVPLEEKIAEAKKIIELSCYKKVVDSSGKEQTMYWVDTPKRYFLTLLALIRMYTDIAISDNPLEDYNTLACKKYDKLILSNLPADDAEEFSNILDMMCDDENENINSLEGRIKNFTIGFDAILQQALTQIINKTESEVNDGLERKDEGDLVN